MHSIILLNSFIVRFLHSKYLQALDRQTRRLKKGHISIMRQRKYIKRAGPQAIMTCNLCLKYGFDAPNTFRVLLQRNKIARTAGQTDGLTDGQRQNKIPPPSVGDKNESSFT